MTLQEWNNRFDKMIADFALNIITFDEYQKEMKYLRRIHWRLVK